MKKRKEKRKPVYSLQPFINNKSKILFIGTAPGETSKSFYYQNNRTKFWKCLFEIYKPKQDFNHLYRDKKIFCQMKYLDDNGIALWDICKKCTRIGSSDNTIKIIKHNNIYDLLEQYKNIKLILICGKKANKLVKKFFPNLKCEEFPSFSSEKSVKDLSKKLKKFLRRNNLI